MREIKFRVWDGEIMGEVKYMEFPLNDSFPVMQYTGLKDKNGKEIYEGDIVKFRDHIYPKLGKKVGSVGFSDASFRIESDPMNHYRWMDYECEIIGNIYENPALLQPTG